MMMKSYFFHHIYFDTFAYCIMLMLHKMHRKIKFPVSLVRHLHLHFQLKSHLFISLFYSSLHSVHWHCWDLFHACFQALAFPNTSKAWDLHILFRFSSYHILFAIIDLIECSLCLSLHLFIRAFACTIDGLNVPIHIYLLLAHNEVNGNHLEILSMLIKCTSGNTAHTQTPIHIQTTCCDENVSIFCNFIGLDSYRRTLHKIHKETKKELKTKKKKKKNFGTWCCEPVVHQKRL